ncbi:pyridoxamine 5'-phosphate oxidase family protein [Bacteroidota bacterium]
MSRESEFIDKNSNSGNLATVDEDGRPRVRAFGLMRREETRLVFATSNKKAVYSQLQANPYAEWIINSEDYFTTLRIFGNIVFDDDPEVEKRVLDENPIIKKLYTGREQEFKVFYLENPEYKWFELRKPPPKQD